MNSLTCYGDGNLMELATVLAAGSAIIGGVVWLVRLEGRVDGHQTLFDEREKQFDTLARTGDDRHQEVKTHLLHIEERLDHIIQSGRVG